MTKDKAEYTKGRFTIHDLSTEDRGYDADSEPLKSTTPVVNFSGTSFYNSSSTGSGCTPMSNESSWFSLSRESHPPVGMREDDEQGIFWASSHEFVELARVSSDPQILMADVNHEQHRRTSSVPPSFRMGRFEVRDMEEADIDESEEEKRAYEFTPLVAWSDNDSPAEFFFPPPILSTSVELCRVSSVNLNVFPSPAPEDVVPQQAPQLQPQNSSLASHLSLDDLLSALKTRMCGASDQFQVLQKENVKLKDENIRLRNLCLSLAASCGIDISSVLEMRSDTCSRRCSGTKF